jgi:hypothetical protein
MPSVPSFDPTVKTRLTALEAEDVSLQAEIDAEEVARAALAVRVTTAENDINAVEAAATTLAGRVTTAESDINAAEVDINALEISYTALDTRVDALESSSGEEDANLCTSQADIVGILADTTILSSPQIAAGDINIATTLSNGYKIGSKLVGQGHGEPIGPASANRGKLTALIWAGNRGPGDTDPIINLRGANCSVQDLSIWGTSFGNIGVQARAPVGVRINQDPGVGDETIGGGKVSLNDVYIAQCRTGIQIASVFGEGNCDESHYNHVTLDRCDVGFHAVNLFAFGHRFYNTNIHQCPIAFKFNAGGDFSSFGGLYTTNGTFLKIDPSPDSSGLGENAAKFCFYNQQFDSAAQNAKILDMTSGFFYNNLLIYMEPQFPTEVWSNYAFKLVSGTHLVINLGGKLKQDSIMWQDITAPYSPTCTITNSQCQVVSDIRELFIDTIAGGSSGDLYVRSYGNWADNGTPLPDETFTLTAS